MVDGIQGNYQMFGAGMSTKPQALTDDEKSKIKSILSNYDPDNVTAEDAKSIFDAFREAGIRPGPGMKEAIDDAGFDAEELRSLARPDDAPPPPPPQSHRQGSKASGSGIDISVLQNLQSILGQYDLSNLSSDQENQLVSQLNQAGLIKSGYIIDLSA
jgi:hypothetical protein